MQRDAWYPGLVSVLRAVLCWCSAFWLFTLIEHRVPLGISVVPYLLFGLLSYLFLSWFMRRERTIPALVAVGTVLWGVGSLVLLLRFSTLVGILANVFGVFSVLTVVLFGVRACMEVPAAAGSIAALEGTTLFFLFFMWVYRVYELEVFYVLPLLAATLLSLSVVMYQRLSAVGGTGGHGRLRALAVVLPVLAIIVAELVLFMAFGAEVLGQGALMLYYGVLYCLKLMWSLFERFLFWLFSLFPAEEGELVMEPPPEMIVVEGMPEEVQLPPWLLIALGAVGICVVLAAVIYILFRLRNVRVVGRKFGGTGTAVKRERLPFRRWLRRLLTMLRSRLLVIWILVAKRGTPQELYLYLKRAGRRLDCRQQTGETPCAFVRRMAHAAENDADPELPQALEQLATALGACLYAKTPPEPLSKNVVLCIRRKFRRALRRNWGTRLCRLVREKLSKKNTAAELP